MNSTQNLVSTIIPVYNRPKMLQAAVDSVLAQTHRPIEIIIADDGSTDETPIIASQLVQQHPQTIHYVRHANAGPGPARELGRRNATGEFIQYLDSDDRLLPNKFQDQIAVLRQNPQCGVAYGITRLVNPQNEVLADPFKWTGRKIDTLLPGLLVDRWWCTHTPLYRRSLTDQIGPWSDMRWSQDWEYDSRIAALGTQVISCGTPVSEHVEHDGVRQTSDAKWTTDPVRLRNRLELLTALWKAAVQAGVSESAPERQHFARWCFSIGRQCAGQKLIDEANACFELAIESAGPAGVGRRGITLYRRLLRVLGPTATHALESLPKIVRRRPSDATMDQSFVTSR